MPAADSVRIVQLERWFLRRGVPHLIDHYNASEDVLTRALPLLVLVFLVEVVGALNESWPVWANALSIAGGLAVLTGGWMVANRLRNRHLLARPERVGTTEVLVFVFVPALLPVVFGGDAGEAAAVAIVNALLLGIVYISTSYGLVPMTRWAVGRVLSQLRETLSLFARALPLLLLVFMFLFINAEVWTVASGLTLALLALTLGLLGAVALIFVMVRVPSELRLAGGFDSWDDVMSCTGNSPLAGVEPRSASPANVPPPSRREWANLGLVMVFSQAMQILFISALVAGFFIAFGVLTISTEIVAAWTAPAVNPAPIIDLDVGGRTLVLTEELLKVSAFLGTFAGLYFAVYAVHDPAFRSAFFEEISGEIRESLAVRAVYRDVLVPG